MSDNPTVDFSSLTKLTFLKPSYTINFHNGIEMVGRLDFNGPKMTFEGDADASVELFVRAFGHWFEGRLKQERDFEREACAKVCDEVECGSAMMIEERHTAAQCARKIRARSKT